MALSSPTTCRTNVWSTIAVAAALKSLPSNVRPVSAETSNTATKAWST
jgi:hypothetical protein